MESAPSTETRDPASRAPSGRGVLERLGATGLERVLSDLLDPSRLVKLANACKLSYPGMRVQAQKREKIVKDLAAKALVDDAAAAKLLRVCRKEAGAAAKAWSVRGSEPRIEQLRAEAGSRDGTLGETLFAAADSALDAAVEHALRDAVAALARESSSQKPNPASAPEERRELVRLRKRSTELQKKVRHLESQLGKYRESEKNLKKDLIQRKGELAESRMLAERLRRELLDAKGAAGASNGKAEPTPEIVAGIERELKKLLSEQKRLVHRIEKLAGAPPPVAALPDGLLAPLMSRVSDLEREIAGLRKERKRDLAEQTRRFDEIQTTALAARAAAEKSVGATKIPARRRGEAERVGVFIDVQNVWYGARQLKGKLDFDALLQAAVRDRRLIQATAYVVESKEIDQSGFIAHLDQRGIDVKRKTLKVRSDGSTKGDWDMEMALDMLDASPRLHVIVLVSGDGDFTSLVRRIKAIGPKVEVLSFPRNTAKSLIEASDKFQPLDRKYMIRDASSPGDSSASRPKSDGKGETSS